MTISFNNIPNTTRTPGVFAEIDNSRALKSLVANPHKALILGQKLSTGTKGFDSLDAISSDGLADGYYGAGSVLARMCKIFKENNPNTELYAMALGSGIGGVAASGSIDFSTALDGNEASGDGTYYLMINGTQFEVGITSNMSGQAIASAVKALTDVNSDLPVVVKINGGSVIFSAVQSGTLGNYINIRANYYPGNSTPNLFSAEPVIVSCVGGSIDPDIGDAWAVVDGEQFHYIIEPYIDTANLGEIESELEDRFKPLEDLQGHAFTATRVDALASATTQGNAENSPHITMMAAQDSPTCPEEWAAALGAQAAFNLNQDPARPLHTLKLKGILPPPVENRFNRAEREILLYDGIATWITDASDNVLIERCITTYQTNALGIPDASYLDVQTLATLSELRYQFKARMTTRFIVPRFKLADDSFPVQAGMNVATPKTIRQEIIALFTQLRDVGLIENLEDFADNLRVERNENDRNRVDALLPPDLINQFRVLAGLIQFIL